jgi:hypothetical protein
MVVEVVAGVLIGLLAVATVIAAYLGILGLARAANLTWCPFCRRMELRPSGAGDSCVRADRARHPEHSPATAMLHAHRHLPRVVLHRHH